MPSVKKLSAIRRQISLSLLDNPALVESILARPAREAVQDNRQFINQTAELTALVDKLHQADVADLLESLPHNARLALWRLIPLDKRGLVLYEASDTISDDLIAEMSDKDILRAIRPLDIDDQAQLARRLPRHLLGRILTALDPQQRTQLRETIQYDEECVGYLVDFNLLTVRPDVSLATVQRFLRRHRTIPQATDKLFVTDRKNRLLGELTLTNILLHTPDTLVEHLMDMEPQVFEPETPIVEVASAFERYDLISAAVVDSRGKLMGRVTVEDIVDMVNRASDHHLHRSGGLKNSEDVYAPIGKAVKNRSGWLAINLCTALIASRVIGLFEDTLAHLVALATLMPIVAGIGGNTGNQTITMIVRALALHQLDHSKKSTLLLKELGVASVNGVIWGAVLAVITVLLYGNIAMGGVMMLAIVLNLLLAAMMAVTIPLLMVKLGRDPAVGASVMITAITDTGGFFIFLGLATVFLLP